MKQISIILLMAAALITGHMSYAQATQTITGHIFDEASKAPLIGATIAVMQTSPAMGMVTDVDGNFKISGIPIGRYSLRVTYTGYEDRVVNDVLITAGKEVHLNIGVQEALRKLNEVVITYNKGRDKTRTNNDMALVSARSFNVDETKRYAGALGDPSRMAANFAGVVSGDDSRNDIVVRGNSPAGMLWQLEGLNIPNPNHYGSLGTTGGPVSMINNNNIDKSDFITSAFPAEYGNALSGVFDIKQREGNKERPEFLAQLGFNGFEAGAEGPIGKNKKTSYVVNYRYSALALFQKMGMDFGAGSAIPYYQDLNYKITSNITKRSKLTFFGIAGTSKIDFLGKDIDTTQNNLYSGDPYANAYNRFSTSVTGASYEYRINDKTYTKLTLGYSTTFERFTLDSISAADRALYPNFYSKMSTGKMSGVWTIRHKINAKNNITAGATYDQTSFALLSKEMHPGQADKVYLDQDGGMGLAQAYGEWKHRYNNKLSSVAGVHTQYLTINNSFAVEPRVGLRYALTKRQALSVGYGLHHQAQSVFTYYVQTQEPTGTSYTNKNLGFTASQHGVITYDWNITDRLRIKAEAYYQSLSNVPVERRMSSYSMLNSGSTFGIDGTDSLVNKGSGRNIGTELTIERFFDKGYYFLITASLFDSKYKGSNGVEHNTAFNTGHVLNVLAGKEFKLGHKGSVLALNLKLCNVGGRYFTPIDLEQSKKDGHTVWMDDLAFSKKQPDYFRTDFRIAYRKEFKKSTLEVAVDFQNLTNNKNIYEQYYNARQNKIITTYQQSFFPVPTLRFTF